MLFGDKYREFLKKNIVSARDAAGNSEIVCRCRYCPDSNDPRHGHMYISIPQNDEDISVFYCQKCHTAGYVTNRTLIEWGIYDPEISSELININKRASKHGKTRQYDRQVFQLQNYIYNYDLAARKLEYINNRIGVNFTFEEAIKNKVIFNIGEVIEYNHIEQLTRHFNIVKQLNDQFVGFLSLDNNFVNLRRICDEGIVYHSIDKRYINYNIHGKKDNTEKFYIAPIEVNLSNPYRVKLNIAEGWFDITSVKYNLRNNEPGIYGAISGSAYKGMIMRILSMGIYYVEVHIYPDNDKSGGYDVMNDIAHFLRPYNIPLYIHRNTFPGKKDFGVKIDEIIESVERVL